MTEQVPDPAQGEARSYQDDLVLLKTEALNRLLAATGLAAIGWFFFIGMSDVTANASAAGLPVLLGAGTILSYLLCAKAGLRGGSLLYVLALSATIVWASWVYGEAALLAFLALPVAASGVLLGAAAGLTASGLIAVYAVLPIANLPLWSAGLTIVLSVASATLMWVALYPLQTTLHWAWMSYQRERQQTEEARTHRGELAKALSNLDTAYRRLESMNIELDRARQAAVEARRLKAEFAANISHELRTPLNMIIGFSEMMIMSPQSYDHHVLPAAYRGDLQSIYRNAKHLSQLIDDVLDLSQIEAARMGMTRERVSLAKVAAEATATVQQMFTSKALALQTSIPDDLPDLDIDRTRIRQVLINLLNNAGRFTDEGGVTIGAELQDNEVVVSVTDSGIGIDQQDLPKLFEEFRQLDGSIRRKAGGSGLGLSICRKLVEMHGGRIWVKSQRGAGTTIYFSLPLGATADAPLHRDWELAPHVGKPLARQDSVVVIAQDQRTAGIFQRYLDSYRVLPVLSEEEACQKAEEEPARAIIRTEMVRDGNGDGPVGSGQSCYNTPMITCILHQQAGNLERMGIASYLAKPVLQEQLLTTLSGLGDGIHSLLVVDDDPDTVHLLSRMARLAGRPYRITKAFGGEQALEIMAKRKPDAVILDLLMPGVDGYQVLREMRASLRLKDVPVVVATARGREREAITAQALTLTRPEGFAIGDLMRCLKATLDAL